MHEKDINILKLLLFDGRMSYESIAKKVKLTPYLVKKRINELVEMGVIMKFVTNLNFLLLKRSVCYTLVDVKPGTDQHELIERIGQLDEVSGGAISLQNKMQIIHIYSDDYDFKKNLGKLMEFEEIENMENFILLIPPSLGFKSERLNKTDWKIINSMKDNCRKTDVEIANELGISSKTVKRRLGYLRENNIILFMIDLDTSAAEFLSYLLIVKFQRIASESLSNVMKIVKNYFYVWKIANQEAFIFTVFIDKLRDIDEQVKEIEKNPYIKEVISFVPTKMFYFESWIDKLIKKNAFA
ncbi:MAG: winged helix-turn-helix transcriptional regulator [Promethearchaeota archaeon]|nr:MAG: winged helix-turn-helix transcriptional regulator [Candidatus Lokiarchaeota archaeon]